MKCKNAGRKTREKNRISRFLTVCTILLALFLIIIIIIINFTALESNACKANEWDKARPFKTADCARNSTVRQIAETDKVLSEFVICVPMRFRFHITTKITV